jgi:hypothetical protein
MLQSGRADAYQVYIKNIETYTVWDVSVTTEIDAIAKTKKTTDYKPDTFTTGVDSGQYFPKIEIPDDRRILSLQYTDQSGSLNGPVITPNGGSGYYLIANVPEVPTWALLILGFGASALVGRRGVRSLSALPPV